MALSATDTRSKVQKSGADLSFSGDPDLKSRLAQLTRDHFNQTLTQTYRDTDTIFIYLMLVQWVLCVILSHTVAAQTSTATPPSTTSEFLSALLDVRLLTLLPIVLAIRYPGRVFTRHCIAVGQMLTSSIIIHLTGGRIESHFHILGSLAFLSFYRDWKVLVTATAVWGIDHFFRGWYFPQSIYSDGHAGWWRFLEHGGWVLFEDVFLLISCRQSLAEKWRIADQQARQELQNEDVRIEVTFRTAELQASEARVRSVLDATVDAILTIKENGEIVSSNFSGLKMIGVDEDQIVELAIADIVPNLNWRQITLSTHFPVCERTIARTATGTEFPVDYCVSQVELLADDLMYTIVMRDISEQVAAEKERDKLQQQFVAAARQAGKAEIASGVLHNVGNILNSISTSQAMLTDMVKSSRAIRIRDVASLLDEHKDHLSEFIAEDPRGSQLPIFFSKLAVQIDGERDQFIEELATIAKSIEHIKVIIAMQQSLAKAGGLREYHNLSQLIHEAVAFNSGRIERHGIETRLDLDDLDEVLVDKHQLMQILVNLLKNGVDAMQNEEGNRKLMTVSLRLTPEGYVQISVSDSGHGISPENLAKVFAQGFTTKTDGHGFGLHSCALAIKDMGGRIQVDSAGIGQGATFSVELPYESMGVAV